MATKSYVVTSPLVVVKDKEGHDRYLYKGAQLPSDVDTDHRKQLLDEKQVEEQESDSEETTAQASPTEETASSGRRSRSGS